MSQETRRDVEQGLEREIGRNGWGLVGRLGAVVGGIVFVPTVTGLIWVGSIDTRVDDNSKAAEDLTRRVMASETAQATILERVDGVRGQLNYLIRKLDAAPDNGPEGGR